MPERCGLREHTMITPTSSATLLLPLLSLLAVTRAAEDGAGTWSKDRKGSWTRHRSSFVDDGNDNDSPKDYTDTAPTFPAPGPMGPSAPACTTEEEWKQLDWTKALEGRLAVSTAETETANTRADAAEGRAEAARYEEVELYQLPDKYDDMSQVT